MKMPNIVKIIGREIIDSRGYPTVEAEVYLTSGIIKKASVPSGASTGSYEAIELRDNDIHRFLGKGVLKAIETINGPICQALKGKDATNQSFLDKIMIELDGTENKSKFGANSILAVSLAIAKSAAAFQKKPLYEYISTLYKNSAQFSMPLPMINIINGGKHANNNIDIQEFMIQPISASSIREAIQMSAEIFHHLKKILQQNGLNTTIGDEGGYAPNLKSNHEAFEYIKQAVIQAGYNFGKDIVLAIDCAASELFDASTQTYTLSNEKKTFTSQEFTHYLENLTKQYPIVSIEDGLHESDWNGFLYQTKILGNKIQLVGDDLFVTNIHRLKKGIDQGIVNSILIKLNQIGSLTETLLVIKMAQDANYATIISHRSGETEDVTIADLAVGTSSGQIKTGSMSRTDRTSKYNQLLRIEEKLGKDAPFKGLYEIKNQCRYLFYDNIN